MRPVIRHFGNVNRSSVNDALRMVHSYCSASTTIDVQRPTLCDPVHFQVFADPQTGPPVVGTILSFLTVDVAEVFPAPLLACLRGALKNVSDAYEQSEYEPADPIADLVAAMCVSMPPGPFVQPTSKEKRDYFAELWNLKKSRVGASRKKRVVEGRAQGKAPAQGASKKRARTKGASSKKKGRPTNKKKLLAGAASQMIASFFKPSAYFIILFFEGA